MDRVRVGLRGRMSAGGTWAAAALAVALLGTPVVPDAVAQGTPARITDSQACGGAAPPAQREKACALVLQNSALKPKDAALIHYFRGFALRDLKQGDAALAEFSDAVRLDPELWPANWVRAELLMGRRYYDKAVAAWSDVINRNPQLASLYWERGSAWDNQSRRAEAIGDYTKAIDLAGSKDSLAHFYLDRAVSYEGDRQWAKALADYAEAIRRDDRLSRAYYGRARVQFLGGDAGSAVADFDKALERDPADYYPLLWLYLAQVRGSKDALVELKRRAASLDLAKWPGPIIRVFLGELTPEQVRPPAQPEAWTEEDRKAGAACEVSFYVGELRLAKGERAKAMALFRAAVATGIKEYLEHGAAAYELDRMSR